MSRAEEFIKNHTNNQANISIEISNGGKMQSYSIPWLTLEDTRKAVKIAREETLLEVVAWINDTFIFSKQAKEDFSQTFNIMKELL